MFRYDHKSSALLFHCPMRIFKRNDSNKKAQIIVRFVQQYRIRSIFLESPWRHPACMMKSCCMDSQSGWSGSRLFSIYGRYQADWILGNGRFLSRVIGHDRACTTRPHTATVRRAPRCGTGRRVWPVFQRPRDEFRPVTPTSVR